MVLNLEIRSYKTENPRHHHDFAQLVLPICGRMEIDVDGQGGCIDQSLAALVTPGSVHSQLTHSNSRFLVLDCAPATLETLHLERLAQRIYVPISQATRRLIEFAELVGNDQLSVGASQLAPLLLSSLSSETFQSSPGMKQLIAHLRAHPGVSWSNEMMARTANMSMSQLHQRFRQLFGKTPQAWLAGLRIDEAQRWLRSSSLPIADIALRTGFCDQAALTRAMQRLCGTTPGAYRKIQQQSR